MLEAEQESTLMRVDDATVHTSSAAFMQSNARGQWCEHIHEFLGDAMGPSGGMFYWEPQNGFLWRFGFFISQRSLWVR